MSLSLRFGFYAIVLLLAAVLTASYVFDGERSAILELNEREHVRLHAERAADELLRNIEDLRKDALFLAGTPPLQEVRRLLREAPQQPLDSARFTEWYGRLERLFLAFGTAHPGYFQLRLIANGENGRELVSVERRAEQLVALRRPQLQHEGDPYYLRAARRLGNGEVLLSAIDPSRGQGQGVAEQPTLRAVVPLAGPDGAGFAMLVLSLDMGQVFDRLARYVPTSGRLYVINEDGHFLQHPNPAKRVGFERAQPYHIEQEFPGQAAPMKNLAAGATRHFDVTHGREAALAYATTREIDGGDGSARRVTLILTEPLLDARREIASARRKSYATIGLLLGVTAGFAVFLANRLTRSLRALVGVSHALARGNYNMEVPHSPERDLQKLTAAFRHMIDALRQREESLTSINQSLEDKVRQRTRELSDSQAALAREQAMMQSILDHVGDGVVAVDAEGGLLLCNNSTVKLLGTHPDQVPPEAWSRHFGLHRSATGEPVGSAESFIVRALNGETVRNEEVFVRNAGQPDGRWISVFARPLGTGDLLDGGAVAVLVDIHETREVRDQRNAQLQELAQIGRLALIGQIIDTATHRLSQPLAAIANYAGAAIQMRSHGRLDDRRLGEILEHVSRLAERAGEALVALRTLTPRGGRPVGEVDVNTATRTALDLLADRTQRQKIAVEQRLAADLPTVTGRRAELQQAIIHLVMNAIEALETAEGGAARRMIVRTACDAARRHLKITVCDNGPGIAPDQREQIFEPWYTTKTDALGLGLAVVRSVVEAHNGSLRIEEMEEGMTCFVIDLPLGGEAHG